MSAPASTKTCGDCYHREALLASEFAACIHCFAIYPPADITLWTDHEQSAVCPHCGVDAVVGFDGSVDTQWLVQERSRDFE